MSAPSSAWYHQPAMLVVAGVLSFTVITGTAMLALSLHQRDALTMSDADYRAWKDDMRATTPGTEQRAPSPDPVDD